MEARSSGGAGDGVGTEIHAWLILIHTDTCLTNTLTNTHWYALVCLIHTSVYQEGPEGSFLDIDPLIQTSVY